MYDILMLYLDVRYVDASSRCTIFRCFISMYEILMLYLDVLYVDALYRWTIC